MRPPRSPVRACVLVLPGGKVRSDDTSRWWQLANLRMVFIAGTLRRRLGRDVLVRRVQYRRRGWNSPGLDAVRDAEEALGQLCRRFVPQHIVLVGHSMGGRVAAHLAGRGDIGAVVALAPWWTESDGDRIPVRTRLLVLHGTADTWTDPRSSRTQTCRARRRGVDAMWVGVEGAGHYMVRRWSGWHQRSTDFVVEYLAAPVGSSVGYSPGRQEGK
nr:alpha/beta hydrolase [Mycobacterium persicum]